MTGTNPFGKTITTDDIVETLGFFDDWEERYRYIIDLGKQLPVMADTLRTEGRLIAGCQSQVWIDYQIQGGLVSFDVDSDAHIVRGLLGIVMSAYNGKLPKDIVAFDIEKYFDQLDLVKHLSPTRGNGLRAMVARIRHIAETELKSSA
ncbi:MAG: SufE family protein [Pseudomonadales bacterium]|nr:SufE family protein [Pseudomonadales bacterium]